MKHTDMIAVANAYGWQQIEADSMMSFRHEERHMRMNIYPTTLSITIQGEGKNLSYRRVTELEKFEDICMMGTA